MHGPDDFPPPLTPLDVDTYNLTRLLVLAVCGVSVCGLCAPFVLAYSTSTLKRMTADGIYSGTERILVNVARILGFIGTVVLAAIILFALMRYSSAPGIKRIPYE